MPSAPAPPLDVPVLEGRHVRLEPLSLSHVPALSEVAFDPTLWEWTVSQVRTPEELWRYVEQALADRVAGTAFAFAQVERADGRAVGSTRFANFSAEHSRIEIGWTWIARPWQRTAINSEAKLLLMTHAFETMGLRRVELKADALNVQSRTAIRRLGAVEEGVLRQHMASATGRVRDTVYYSVLRDEWPGVRERLTAGLGAGS